MKERISYAKKKSQEGSERSIIKYKACNCTQDTITARKNKNYSDKLISMDRPIKFLDVYKNT